MKSRVQGIWCDLMIPLQTSARVAGHHSKPIFKVLTIEEAARDDWPTANCLAYDPDGTVETSSLGEWAGLLTPIDRDMPADWPGLWVDSVANPEVVRAGDVIRVNPDRGQVHVLYRRGAKANFLFATDRCNNYCLMCSQPPLEVEDSWRVREMIQTVFLVDREEGQLGITGGEPTLLGQGLADVLAACQEYLPDTYLHVLTNGRQFADPAFADLVGLAYPEKVMWAVPLYGDCPEEHDYVVQARGAFDETLKGLYNLGARGLRIEIRVVLHKLTIPRLGALANFIYRNLPFVSHVALMGLEPMGFTKLNRELLWIDPADYIVELSDATFHLANRGMKVSIYNLPFCVLPRELWPFSRQSISDWKNAFAPECVSCTAIEHCAGFFKSAGPNWRSRAVAPILQYADGSANSVPVTMMPGVRNP